MNPDDCFKIGQIIKAHGVKGEVLAELDIESPEEFEKLESVFLDINQKLVPFFIDDISVSNKKAIIKFEDIDSIEETKSILKKNIYIKSEDLPESEDGDFYFEVLIGYKVKDKNKGEIGPLKEYIERPGQDLLVVDYQGKEVYVPVDKSIILKVDNKKKILTVNLPEGLLEL